MRGLTLRAVILGVRAGDRVVIDGARPVDAEVQGFGRGPLPPSRSETRAGWASTIARSAGSRLDRRAARRSSGG
ncbi:MAG: hypothetical protein R3A52_30405 [Polyangiales bacterium]